MNKLTLVTYLIIKAECKKNINWNYNNKDSNVTFYIM